MSAPELIILDVGHGNCSIVKNDRNVVVIDAPTGSTLLDTLNEMKISDVDTVIISHADADHIGGIIALLLSDTISVKRVYANPDSQKNTVVWQDLLSVLAEVRKKKQVVIVPSISAQTSQELQMGDLKFDILSPDSVMALRGVGGKTEDGKVITSNSMSVALRVLYKESPAAFLSGDIDQIALNNLLSSGVDLSADILVFPHHGGLPGGVANARSFSKDLCSKVSPSLIVFSIGRGSHGTPNSEVILGVKEGAPEAHIFCTQLSENCAAKVPETNNKHLSKYPAKGKSKNQSCGGSLQVDLSKGAQVNQHKKFVKKYIPNRICG